MLSNKMINFGLALAALTFGLTATADETDYNFEGLKANQFEGKSSKDLSNEEILTILEEMPLFLREVARANQARIDKTNEAVDLSNGKFFKIDFSGRALPGWGSHPIGRSNYKNYLDSMEAEKIAVSSYAEGIECAYTVFQKTEKNMGKNKVHFSKVKRLSSLSGWKDQSNIITPCMKDKPVLFGLHEHQASEMLKRYRTLLSPWI